MSIEKICPICNLPYQEESTKCSQCDWLLEGEHRLGVLNVELELDYDRQLATARHKWQQNQIATLRVELKILQDKLNEILNNEPILRLEPVAGFKTALPELEHNPNLIQDNSFTVYEPTASATTAKFTEGNSAEEAPQMSTTQTTAEANPATLEKVQTILLEESNQTVGAVANISSFTNSNILTVGGGDGTYSTIEDALQAAAPNSCILIRPGLYKESLVLDKPIELKGDGSVSDIVLENQAARCLWVKTEQVMVRGLTIRNYGRLPDENYPTIEVTVGDLQLENCNISSEEYPAILVYGKQVRIRLQTSTIHSDKWGGLIVREKARGEVMDCKIHSSSIFGILVTAEANLYLNATDVSGQKGYGLLVSGGGRLTLEKCAVFNNSQAGIKVTRDGTTVLKQCQINNNEYGLEILNGGNSKIEECNMDNNILGAWKIEPEARIKVINNQI